MLSIVSMQKQAAAVWGNGLFCIARQVARVHAASPLFPPSPPLRTHAAAAGGAGGPHSIPAKPAAQVHGQWRTRAEPRAGGGEPRGLTPSRKEGGKDGGADAPIAADPLAFEFDRPDGLYEPDRPANIASPTVDEVEEEEEKGDPDFLEQEFDRPVDSPKHASPELKPKPKPGPPSSSSFRHM